MQQNLVPNSKWRTLRGAAVVSFLFILFSAGTLLADLFIDPSKSVIRQLITNQTNLISGGFNIYYILSIVGGVFLILNIFIWIFGSISGIMKSSKVNSSSMTIICALWLIFSSVPLLLPLVVAALCTQQIQRNNMNQYPSDPATNYKESQTEHALRNQLQQQAIRQKQMQEYYENKLTKQRLALAPSQAEYNYTSQRPQLNAANVGVQSKLLEIEDMFNSGLISEKEYLVLKKRLIK